MVTYRHWLLLPGIIFITSVTSCDEETAPSIVPCSFSLYTPKIDAVLDNGCYDSSNSSSWKFEWSPCPGAVSYHIFVDNPDYSSPAVDENVVTTSYTHDLGSAFYLSEDIDNWRWKVRPLYDGYSGNWSEERRFNLEAPNSDCPCDIQLISPQNGELMDNSCTGGQNVLTWTFVWKGCSGATSYDLQVFKFGDDFNLIDRSDIIAETYTTSGTGGYFVGVNCLDWRWRVRPVYNGIPGDWSEEGEFDIDPVDTDCP
jgi:hypothetical protein